MDAFAVDSTESVVEENESREDETLLESVSDSDNTKNPEYEVLKNEANALAKSQHLEESLLKYDEAMLKAKSDTEFSILHHNKGIVHETMEDYEDALEQYVEAVRLNPNYYKALKRKAKMLKQLELYEEAKNSMRDVFLLERKNSMGNQIDTKSLWQDIIHNIGVTKALNLMQEDRPIVPTVAETELMLRILFCDPVSILWKKAPIADDNYSELKGYAAAVNALQRRDYDMIIPHCDVELQDSKSDFKDEALFLRGTFRSISGCGKSAIKDFTSVISSKNPKTSRRTKSSAALKCAVCLYYQSVDDEQIQKFIGMANDHWSMNSDVYYLVAMVRNDNIEDYKTSAGILEMAIESCPITESSNLYTTEYFEVLYMKNSLLEEGEKECKQILSDMAVLERKFDFANCYYNYYMILMRAGKIDEANSKLEKAISMDPKNINYLVARIVGQDFEKTPEIIANKLVELHQLEENYGKSTLVSYHIGCLELYLDNTDKGWKYFDKSIENSRSIPEIVSRVIVKLDWEMKQELNELLGVKTKDFSSLEDNTLFDRRKIYDPIRKITHICYKCGGECSAKNSEESEDTDEDDD